MATKKTRLRRASARRQPARSHSSSSFTPAIHHELAGIVRELRFATATVVVCIEALRRRNVEMDEEIALVLRRAASDRLDAGIEKLEALAGAPPRDP